MPTATVRVLLGHAYNKTVTVDYATSDGTGRAGQHYTAASGTLTFAPGDLEKRVPLTVFATTAPTPRDFFLVLSSPVNAVLVRSTATITIPVGSGPAAQNGPLILNGLITNAFHTEFGRGGYFHPVSGTSEGQSIGIQGSFLAWRALTGGTPAEDTAAAWYLDNALDMLDALGDGSPDGPLLRQPIPSDPNTITMLHWLFAARGDVPEQGVNYDFWTTVQNGRLIIPATVPGHQGGADVYRVWMIYPRSSALLYRSPYSPAYDAVTPAGDTSIRLDDGFAGPLTQPSPHWSRVGDTVEVPLPASAPAGITEWSVVYAYGNLGTIHTGQAQEAYPNWTSIEDGYVACAPDTFRWFEYAIELARAFDPRPGKAAQWTHLRDAMRRSCVKGQALTDLREVLKPLPQFPVFAPRGEPSGMFCYSEHPAAEPPPQDIIDQGGNPAWTGYNFWSRVGGSGGAVPAGGGFTWRPEVMFYPPAWTGDIFNGALQWDVPTGTGQVQIGRGFNDDWREATAYQDADQFLFVALVTDRIPDPLAPDEHLYVFVSATKYYDPDTRWYADLKWHGDMGVGPSTDGGPRYFLIPRTDFKTFGDAVLPAGTRFENFGLSIEMPGPHSGKLVALRLVGGASAQAVLADYAGHVRGAKMPFFPGTLPFAINADAIRQQYIGWNGSPFHGYQLPDFWYFLQADADAVHPTLDPARDLPIPHPTTGELIHPITANTIGGAAKPRHALLMEQQLLFLKAAQDRYAADGGQQGPFGHTFVLNTPARMSLGWPTPHTWVYINDDPNTRWLGYQCRVVESLACLVDLTRADAAFEDARTLALSMTLAWLTRLNDLWPNLDGKAVIINDVQTILYGMPTDWPDPRISPPQTLYEEPHGPSLILRACFWLKASGLLDGAQTTLVDTLGQRCWDYMETRYRQGPQDTMRGTWAIWEGVEDEVWYGFWHFEIIATIAFLALNPAAIPGTIDPALLRQRLVETQAWLLENVEETA